MRLVQTGKFFGKYKVENLKNKLNEEVDLSNNT